MPTTPTTTEVPNLEERVLSRQETARMLGLAPGTIDRLEGRGQIPSRRRITNTRVGWLYSELLAHVRSLQCGPITTRTTAARAARAAKRAAKRVVVAA